LVPAIQDIYEVPELYDLEFHGCDEDLHHYIQLARATKGPILELAAGTGRLALPMARLGRKVCAADRSEKMLAVLERRASQEPQLDIRCVVADMRTPQRRGTYALVVLAFNALQHLRDPADIMTTFRAARVAARSGGRFALDVYLPREDLTELDGAHDETLYIDPRRGQTWRCRQTTLVRDGGTRIITRTEWVDRRGDTQHTTELEQWLHPLPFLESCARATGWRILQSSRDFEDTPAHADGLKWVAVLQAT
jgi:SAM-dependent methyltransferase